MYGNLSYKSGILTTAKQRVVKHAENMKKGWIQLDSDHVFADEEVNIIDIPDKIINLDAFNKKFYEMMSKMR